MNDLLAGSGATMLLCRKSPDNDRTPDFLDINAGHEHVAVTTQGRAKT
jgi:hypothetical protein